MFQFFPHLQSISNRNLHLKASIALCHTTLFSQRNILCVCHRLKIQNNTQLMQYIATPFPLSKQCSATNRALEITGLKAFQCKKLTATNNDLSLRCVFLSLS